jgi:hypothetical protein
LLFIKVTLISTRLLERAFKLKSPVFFKIEPEEINFTQMLRLRVGEKICDPEMNFPISK